MAFLLVLLLLSLLFSSLLLHALYIAQEPVAANLQALQAAAFALYDPSSPLPMSPSGALPEGSGTVASEASFIPDTAHGPTKSITAKMHFIAPTKEGYTLVTNGSHESL